MGVPSFSRPAESHGSPSCSVLSVSSEIEMRLPQSITCPCSARVSPPQCSVPCPSAIHKWGVPFRATTVPGGKLAWDAGPADATEASMNAAETRTSTPVRAPPLMAVLPYHPVHVGRQMSMPGTTLRQHRIHPPQSSPVEATRCRGACLRVAYRPLPAPDQRPRPAGGI